jgi:hypothetical protein
MKQAGLLAYGHRFLVPSHFRFREKQWHIQGAHDYSCGTASDFTPISLLSKKADGLFAPDSFLYTVVMITQTLNVFTVA